MVQPQGPGQQASPPRLPSSFSAQRRKAWLADAVGRTWPPPEVLAGLGRAVPSAASRVEVWVAQAAGCGWPAGTFPHLGAAGAWPGSGRGMAKESAAAADSWSEERWSCPSPAPAASGSSSTTIPSPARQGEDTGSEWWAG